MLQEIYDGNPSKDTVIAVGKIFARIPGFYTAVASELKISPDLVKQILESGSFYTNIDAA